MADNLKVGIVDELIVVTDPATHFYAIYSKHTDRPQLTLERRMATKDQDLLARALQAANDKARELGWLM
jgi:hypothetical protein